MSEKKRQNRHDAFLAEIKAVEDKYGLRIAYAAGPVQVRIINAPKDPAPVSDEARKLAAQLSGHAPLPWWKRIFKRR